MRRTLAVLILALSTLPGIARADDDGPIKLSPQQIGDIFCIGIVGNDMAPVEAIITTPLRKAIDKANKLNDVYMKKNPGEAPPMDGLPWQDSADYTPQCHALNPSIGKDSARVELDYSFPDDAAANFTDQLILKAVPDPEMGGTKWRIDDVQFRDGTDMLHAMTEAFAQ